MAENFSIVLRGLHLDPEIPFALYVVDVAVNSIFSIITILGNTLIMVALWKASRVQVNSVFKVFVFSLALADLGVGLIVQPLYVAAIFTAMNGERNVSRVIGAVFYVLNWFLPNVSFATLTALAIDRVLALYLRLRYRTLVTARRVTIAMLLLWMSMAAGTSLLVWRHNVYNVLANITLGVCFFLTATCYLKIYSTLRRLDCQARSVTPQNTNTCKLVTRQRAFNIARYKRSVCEMFYVNVAFVVCYLPLFCVLVVTQASGTNRTTKVVRFLGSTLIFINSSLNPLLYCWKIREIRRVVLTTVENVSCTCGN